MAVVKSLTFVQDLRLLYENLLDDAPDKDFTYQVLTQAKNRIELENDLYILRDEDSTQTAASGDTYATTHALPERWRKTRYMKIGDGTRNPTSYFPTSYERRQEKQLRRFFIDHRNSVFGFTGVIGTGGTIYHGYQRLTDAFSSTDEDTTPLASVLEWPEEFAPIIAYEAAGFYQEGIDPDDISVTKGQANLARAQSLMDSFIAWDQDLKLSEQGDSLGFADQDDGAVPVGLM